ncbi:MAG: polysaccharide deacetylase family protein [Candidatus Hydrogenedentes bacterium]|nr:polysaccharide deacetylase family protein [Candidatus Hydrogenedentota bacterium]
MPLREIARDAILSWTPLAPLQAMVKRDVVGVNYHLVSAEPSPLVSPLFSFKTPAQFESDLHFLKSHYSMVGYADTAAQILGGRSILPSRAALLTFDDGFAECHTTVRPLLLKHKIPAVFFVITDALNNRFLPYRNRVALCLDRLRRATDDEFGGFASELKALAPQARSSREAAEKWVRSLTNRDTAVLDAIFRLLNIDPQAFLTVRKPFLSTDQILELVRDGFTIGAHSVTHTDFSLLDEPAIEREIVESCAVVCALTGASHAPFAFPFNGNSLKRLFLADVRKRNPHVGLYFDNCGFPLDHEWVVGRMTCDLPGGCSAGHSNLGRWLKRAYARGLVSQITRKQRP